MFTLKNPATGEKAAYILKGDYVKVSLKMASESRYSAPVECSVEAARDSYRNALRNGWVAE